MSLPSTASVPKRKRKQNGIHSLHDFANTVMQQKGISRILQIYCRLLGLSGTRTQSLWIVFAVSKRLVHNRSSLTVRGRPDSANLLRRSNGLRQAWQDRPQSLPHLPG